MRFSDVVRGQHETEEVPIPNATTRNGEPVIARAQALDEDSEERVMREAAKEARAGGEADPKIGAPLYDAAVMVHTVALGYADAESSREKPVLFFDGGASQVRTLGSDEIGYLFERHEVVQNATSPSVRSCTPEQLWQHTLAIAASDGAGPFVVLAPALRAIWARFMARQLIASLGDKSPPGASLPESTHSTNNVALTT